MLLPIARKFFSILIYNRLRDAVGSNMFEEQAGFHQGRGCSDHIFVIRTIIEECEKWKSSLILTFINYRKAFDSVQRLSMWKILEVYGIHRKMVRILTYLDEELCTCWHGTYRTVQCENRSNPRGLILVCFFQRSPRVCSFNFRTVI